MDCQRLPRPFSFLCWMCLSWVAILAFCTAVQAQNTFPNADIAPAVSGGVGPGFFRCSAWGDYNNDGRPDLFAAGDTGQQLFKNNENGTFTDVTDSTGGIRNNRANKNAQGAIWGDFNSDGNLDLFVANNPGPRHLYQNNGNGTFTEVASLKGVVGSATGSSQAAAWGDFDADGDLDLLVANGAGAQNEYFINSGRPNFIFTPAVPLASGVIEPGQMNSHDVVTADFNNDGALDLFVVGDPTAGDLTGLHSTPNQFLINQGNGTFKNEAAAWGVADKPCQARCAAAGDVNHDGNIDLFIGGKMSIIILRNNGRAFVDATAAAGIVQPGFPVHSCQFVDFDGDSFLDLFYGGTEEEGTYNGNGEHTTQEPTTGGPNFFRALRSTRTNAFTDAKADFLSSDHVYSISFADIDRDGDLDLFVSSYFRTIDNDGRMQMPSISENHLFRNDSTGHHWTRLDLRPFRSNSSAIGARAAVTFNPTLIREVRAGSGGGSMNELDLTIGVGAATQIAELKVSWPSGMTNVLTNVPVDETITIEEEGYPKIDIAIPSRVPLTGGRKILIIGENLEVLNNTNFRVGGLPVTDFEIVDDGSNGSGGTANADQDDGTVAATFTAPPNPTPGLVSLQGLNPENGQLEDLLVDGLRYVDRATFSFAYTGPKTGEEPSAAHYRMQAIPLVSLASQPVPSEPDNNTGSTGSTNTAKTRLQLTSTISQQLIAGGLTYPIPTVARIFWFNGEDYDEGLNIPVDDFLETLGFWVIARTSHTISLTGGATNQLTTDGEPDPPNTMLIHSGWNQVSPGYLGQSILPENVFVSDGDEPVAVIDTSHDLTTHAFLRFDPTALVIGTDGTVTATANTYPEVARTEPLTGDQSYWLHNKTDGPLILIFGPPREETTNSTGGNTTGNNTTGTTQRFSRGLRKFLRSDPSKMSLPASVKYAMTGNAEGLTRAAVPSPAPPPPPGVVLASSSGTTSSAGGAGGSAGGCFIATAAWGSPLDERIRSLSTFRDRSLLPSQLGRAFTATYYANSPAAATALRASPTARTLARRLLKPLVRAAEQSPSVPIRHAP